MPTFVDTTPFYRRRNVYCLLCYHCSGRSAAFEVCQLLPSGARNHRLLDVVIDISIKQVVQRSLPQRESFKMFGQGKPFDDKIGVVNRDVKKPQGLWDCGRASTDKGVV